MGEYTSFQPINIGKKVFLKGDFKRKIEEFQKNFIKFREKFF